MTRIELGSGLLALFGDGPPTTVATYPTSPLCRGMRLALAAPDGDAPLDLNQEGVGFGVPVLRLSGRSVFAGSARVCDHLHSDAACRTIRVLYHLDRIETLHLGALTSRPIPAVDRLRDAFSATHRAIPALRRPLDHASIRVHHLLRTSTGYERAPFPAVVAVSYRLYPPAGLIDVEVDARGAVRPGLDEIAVMNELGAGHFTEYDDDRTGRLQGGAIESWTEVRTRAARFSAPRLGLSFSVERDASAEALGVRLFRGREHAAGRLAWAGLALLLPPASPVSRYRIRVERAEGSREGA